MQDIDSLVSLIAQMYKVGIKIDSLNIDKKMIIKLSIPKTSFLYKNVSIENGQKSLMIETNEILNKIFTNIPLEILFRVRDEDFTEKDSLIAEKQTFIDFKDFKQ